MRTIVRNISGTFDKITEFVPLNYKSGKIILCERMFANILPYETKSHCFCINLSTKENGEVHKMSKKFTYFSFAYDLDIMFFQREKIKSILIFNICDSLYFISIAYLLSANLLAIYIMINALNSMLSRLLSI